MAEQEQPDKNKQEGQLAPRGVARPSVQLPAVPIQTAANASNQQTDKGTDPAKPLFVQIVGGDALEPFEEQTLAISRKTYWIAILAFGAALAAAIFVGSQVKIMSYQTQIMASQSESAAAGAAIGELNTRKQLVIAQQQANAAQQQASAAQDSVRAIQKEMRLNQRAWLTLGDTVATVQAAPNAPLAASINMSNTGKTPALSAIANVFLEVVKSDNAPNLDLKTPRPHTTSFIGSIPPNVNPNFLGSRQRHRLDGKQGTEDDPLTVTEFSDLSSGKAYVAVYGIVYYRDIFKTQHWIKFCTWKPLVQQGDFRAGKCSNLNSVDDN